MRALVLLAVGMLSAPETEELELVVDGMVGATLTIEEVDCNPPFISCCLSFWVPASEWVTVGAPVKVCGTRP